MEPITNGEAGQIGPASDRWCTDCGDLLGDAAHLHDGDLVCPGCWYELRLAEEREHLEEAVGELEELAGELAELEATFEREVLDVRRRVATWTRRRGDARQRVAALEAEAEAAMEELAAPAPDPLEGVAPIAGGGHYEPSAEDWAEYRAYCEELEARECEEFMERGEPEATWGYE